MRRIPTQVHENVSRLLAAGITKTPPAWYLPVVTNPPPALPPLRARDRGQLARSGGSPYRGPESSPRPIKYMEDKIRRQFFADFPFEAFRPTSLIEMTRSGEPDPTIPEGEEWQTLEQRGAYPTVEDVLDFTITLRGRQSVVNGVKQRRIPLSAAYVEATQQFVKLRANHEMATMAAELEARHYGATFNKTPFERAIAKEDYALNQHLDADKGLPQARRVKYKKPKEWVASIPDGAIHEEKWSKGSSYVKQWRRPLQPGETRPSNVSLGSAFAQGTTTHIGVETTSSPAEQDTADDTLEDVDDLEFLRRAVRVER